MNNASGSDGSSARAAYDAIAPVYDDFTASYDTELWLGNLLPQLAKSGQRGSRLLDVGCGTGNSFIPMLERGWTVTGCDLSRAMLSKARSKVGAGVTLEVADMRTLPVFGSFDLVWALDDALNYLLTPGELRSAFAGMARNMDGAFSRLMFDLNTLATYRGFFAETVVVERDGLKLQWIGETDPAVLPGAECEARFEVVGADVPTRIHRQRHFPENEVRDILAAVGLDCLAVFGHEEDAVLHQPLEEDRHVKAVYICAFAA